MKILLLTLICATAIAENVQLLDLDPEEVQKLLAQQNTDVHFAPKIESAVPVLRTSPDDKEDWVEDVYESSQFHGQDGLGRFLYGYATPYHSKVEGRNGNGEVRGAYSYVEPSGNVIKVTYWDDGQGFHHEDNIPKVELIPVQESEEVRAARLEHERLWKEAAEANQVAPDIIAQHFNTRLTRQAPAPPAVQPREERQVQPQKKQYEEEEEEVTGPPKGFFYSFIYPTPIKYKKVEYEEKKLANYDDAVASLGTKIV